MKEAYKTIRGKVALVSGASRGIGAQTAKTLAKHGCHVIITGKTSEPHETLEGTIHSVAEECAAYGVQAIAVQCDIKNENDIDKVMLAVTKHFGQLDILINCASAIYLHNSHKITTKEFDEMHQVNVRGSYLMSQSALPLLKASNNGHILNFSPPLVLNAQYFYQNLGYTLSKYSMSMCTLGMAHELYHDNIAVNSLWPRTAIYTVSSEKLLNSKKFDKKYMRKPEIMADAVLEIVTKPARVCTSCFLIDDLVLMGAGVTDFNQYSYEPGHELIKDLFLPHDLPPPPIGTNLI